MTVRLRIVSDQRRSLGDRSSIVLGVAGGTIGRSADNDWVLPDPLRYVSAHHARISCQDGQYFLEDVSTNGSYVNDDTQPLGKTGAPPAQRRPAAARRLPHRRSARCGSRLLAAAEPTSAQADGVPTSINACAPSAGSARRISAPSSM